MRLVMTLVVRNEADIVGTNIEYHLAQGVDFVLVTDHGSEDGTSEILAEYERLGVAKVIRDDRNGHHQGERVTEMVQLARYGYDADWVINNDADEFWWPLVGNLRDVFAALPERYGQLVVQRRNFRPSADEEGPFHSRLVHREAVSLGVFGHALGPKVAHRPLEGVVVAPGNHSVSGPELPVAPCGELLEILHFPMRDYAQFERKVLQTGRGYELVDDRRANVGGDQIELYRIQREGRLREYYEGFVLDERALERALRMGTIVVDRRLEEFMRRVQRGEVAASDPAAPFAGRLLGRLFDALAEEERLGRRLVEAGEERELLLRGQEDLRSRVGRLEDELQTVAGELAETGRALHLLRTSRLLRTTAGARRLYYRALRRG